MANIKEIFLTTINKGLEATSLISDPKDKALAYAQIARALATTGLVRDAVLPKDVDITIEENKEAIKEEAKKATKKKTSQKQKSKQAEETKEESQPEVQETAEPEAQETVETPAEDQETEKELDWDDVTEEVDILNDFKGTYGDDAINECIRAFSDNVLVSIEDITPANIKAFVTYLNMLQNEAE